MIADPHQAEAIGAEGWANWVALARAFVDNLAVELARPPTRSAPTSHARHNYPSAASLLEDKVMICSLP